MLLVQRHRQCDQGRKQPEKAAELRKSIFIKWKMFIHVEELHNILNQSLQKYEQNCHRMLARFVLHCRCFLHENNKNHYNHMQ